MDQVGLCDSFRRRHRKYIVWPVSAFFRRLFYDDVRRLDLNNTQGSERALHHGTYYNNACHQSVQRFSFSRIRVSSEKQNPFILEATCCFSFCSICLPPETWDQIVNEKRKELETAIFVGNIGKNASFIWKCFDSRELRIQIETFGKHF